jgi:CRISPR/Cas system-associated exonuclease Cas4 (RecB family)
LLRHPFGPGLPAEQWREAREAQASGRQGWAEAGVDLESLDLARWPDEDDRGGWVARTTAFLEEHGAYDRAADWSREVVALSHLEDALRWISSPEEQPVRRGEFLSELEELLNLVSAPEHPVEDGVALDTPLSLFGARRRYVFVLGLAEGEFPAQVAEAAALDFHERKELARQGMVLESAAGRARRERLSFHMLLQVPTECLVLSYPRLVGRQPSLPSTYFGLLGLEPALPETVPVASPEEARRAFLREEGNAHHDEVLELARERWRVEMRRESPEPFDEHDGVLGVSVEREGSFSVTELGDLARCGFRWWSGRLLGLSELQEGESPALIGSINHLALELAVDQAIKDGSNGESLRPAVIERLDACFEEAERRHGAYRIRSWGLRRAENLRLLRGAVEGDEFLLPGAEVVGVEKRFEGKWHGLPVRGRLDRVDRTPQGAVIVDYKSGSGASLPTPDFQLTVYEEAAGEDLSESPVTSAYYYSLSKGERVRIRKPDDEEREGVARRMEDALAAGTLPPDALEHDPRGQVCATCSFDVVCRRGPRLRNKAAREA